MSLSLLVLSPQLTVTLKAAPLSPVTVPLSVAVVPSLIVPQPTDKLLPSESPLPSTVIVVACDWLVLKLVVAVVDGGNLRAPPGPACWPEGPVAAGAVVVARAQVGGAVPELNRPGGRAAARRVHRHRGRQRDVAEGRIAARHHDRRRGVRLIDRLVKLVARAVHVRPRVAGVRCYDVMVPSAGFSSVQLASPPTTPISPESVSVASS